MIQHWPRAVLVTAGFLLLLSPLLYYLLGPIFLLVFLQLPFYMLHQVEEHATGKFKRYVNCLLGTGTEILSDEDIFLINLLLVWALNLVALYLAVFVRLSLGLISGYLSLLNGISHLGMGILMQEVNPGFWTSLVLLVPGGAVLIYLLNQLPVVSLQDHAAAAAVVILVHAAIILRVLNKFRR